MKKNIQGFVSKLNIKENPKTKGRYIAEFNIGVRHNEQVEYFNQVSYYLYSDKQKQFIEREVGPGAYIRCRNVDAKTKEYVDRNGERQTHTDYTIPPKGLFVIESLSDLKRKEQETKEAIK